MSSVEMSCCLPFHNKNLSDQHGNINRTNGSAIKDVTKPPTVSKEPVKKESRLKHFFSPIRKKTVTPPLPPPLPPTVPSQPDIFISNILPSNMYVNPMHLQSNNLQKSSRMDSESAMESMSPTSSFQVFNRTAFEALDSRSDF